MTEIRGSWRPAWRALARILVGTLTARVSSPAWTDPESTLTRSALLRASLAEAGRLPRAGNVLVAAGQRQVALTTLGCLLTGRRVRVVPASAGRVAAADAAADTPAAAARISFHTSGTSGRPTHQATARGPRAVGQLISTYGLLPVPRHPLVASLAPIDHGHGWSAFLLTLLAGGHFIAAAGEPDLLAERARIDLLTGVPLHLSELARSVRRLPDIGVVLSGSDRLEDPESLQARFRAPVYDAYGSTETGTVCLASPGMRHRAPGTVGRPLAGVRISEHDGRLSIISPMSAGVPFEGDRGYLDGNLVHVTGRADGRRVTGGVTTSPDAVRGWLLDHEAVTAVEVEEVPDARFGTRLSVMVMSTRPLDGEALRAGLAADLGGAAAPRRITVVVAAGATTADQPLTAPDVMPRTKNRCMLKNSSIGTSIEMNAPAVNSSQP